MDKPNTTLIAAIRRAARNLENSSSYQWGHMGLCNCGFLAQELTGLKKEDIHRRAMERSGDWSDQLNGYCSESGLLIDELIDRILAQGLNRTDLKHLERLSDPLVLRRLGEKGQSLRHNKKEDVVGYMLAWADLLEEKVLEGINLPPLTSMVETENGIRCSL